MKTPRLVKTGWCEAETRTPIFRETVSSLSELLTALSLSLITLTCTANRADPRRSYLLKLGQEEEEEEEEEKKE